MTNEPQDPYAQRPPDPYAQHPPQQPGYAPAPAYGPGPDQAPGYGSAPRYGPAPTGPVTRPQTVKIAVLLMYVGAALSVLSGILALTMQEELRSLMEEEMARQGQELPTEALDLVIQVGLGIAMIFSVLGAVLWVVNAVFNSKGHNWARIVSTVLGAIWLVSFLYNLTQPAPMITLAVNVLNALLVVAVLVLLWLRPSNQFFAASGAARRNR